MIIKFITPGGCTALRECLNLDWWVSTGSREKVQEDIDEHLYPTDTDGVKHIVEEDGERIAAITVGSFSKELETHAAVLVTLEHTEGMPTVIAAPDCSMYIMNDSGKTIDKVDATKDCKHIIPEDESEDSEQSKLNSIISEVSTAARVSANKKAELLSKVQ